MCIRDSPTVLHSDRLPRYLKKLVKLDRCCMVRVCPQVGCGIDDVYQMPNRSTARMRVISRMPAAVFVTWTENKLHSHSPKGMTINYQKMPLKRNGNFANFTVAEPNSYSKVGSAIRTGHLLYAPHSFFTLLLFSSVTVKPAQHSDHQDRQGTRLWNGDG